ncbi:DUF948 domain-containing protein [Fructilactobacillus florum]|uniref:DUF948 domain-containing protein n=1 Tax=Fructilactobacillus florum TaxID=640331 RepID=UPI0006D059BC|nr:DUF948 domain-containing protein [Fructilactobacillus florum]
MTFGEIAALIAAIAFAVLVIFMCVCLVRLVKVLDGVDQSLSDVTKNIDQLTNDTNQLLQNFNERIDQLDPVFQAAAEVGTSVSKVNHTVQTATDRLNQRMEMMAKRSMVKSISRKISGLFSRKKETARASK